MNSKNGMILAIMKRVLAMIKMEGTGRIVNSPVPMLACS